MRFSFLDIEVFYCVIVANVLNNCANKVKVLCHFALFDKGAKIGTKDSTEVVMAWVGKE